MASALKEDQGLAVFSLTEGGAGLGLRLVEALGEGQVFLPGRLKRMAAPVETVEYFERWDEAFSRAFASYSRIICIMAAGIVVRSLAPLIKSKQQDPAVVVLDEKGRYAVSLLSGHWGGANRLAQKVAAVLGGQAVLTTATDVQGQPAIDMLARDMNGIIDPWHRLKLFNRLLAERQRIFLYSPWPVREDIAEAFAWRDWPGNGEDYQEPALIIDYRKPADAQRRELIYLRPRNLYLGIGCRKGVSLEQVKKALARVEEVFRLDLDCAAGLATIDLKKDEPALKELAAEMKLELASFTKDEIGSLDGTYPGSDWVKQKVGVDGVCEPAAILASQTGITLIPKQKLGPVTISVAMERSWWWDWDRVKPGS